ncbi:Leucine-rich repeat receptor-like protein kinase PXC2 [Hibiscus syriacus]|uniref:Leucine-rich repeat receptor-like protein kinase PXC2 n=1 Tax=Hibiscus syriacus TaxID=106335 RepID=A0A6A3B9L5_HIBSY|nr:Leucine-rich repeat receptor-like protein kinase PXC2 [Hibiscus syriacus]
MKNLSTFLLFWLVLSLVTFFPARSLSPSLNDDVLGLIVFRADVEDPSQKLSSWNEDDDTPCNWIGVKCNPRSNRVTELNLNGLSLSGRIGRGILQLKFLRKLSLARNNLSGSISPNLAKLESLRIVDLSENSLSGFVPDDFFKQCGPLRSISLASNRFSGNIPLSLGSCATLAAVNLSWNQFSGTLPGGIWGLSGLRSLDLSANLLEGEIPKGIEALNNLRSINLSKNKFTGQVPDGFGSCLLLRSIDFSMNLLSGSVPHTMQKLSLCSYLNLRMNSFVGEVPGWIGELKRLETLDFSVNNFSGQVPESIGNLKLLKVLNFSANGLTGSLPASMGNNVNLLALDFSQNSMGGELPGWIFKTGLSQVSLSENKLGAKLSNPSLASPGTSLQKIQLLDLSHNSFSGEITNGIGALSSLQFLNLSRNSLIGPIPGTVGELKALNVLDLSYNQLNGSIPMEVGGAFSLKELRLNANILGGKIPTSIGPALLLTTLILSQNNLSGPIPTEIGKLNNLQNVDLSFNKLAGTLPKQLANLPHLLSFNISHNNLQGELPTGGFFNTISPTAVSGNPSLCGSAVNKSCPAVIPKPIVLNPNSSDSISGVLPTTVGHKRITLSISALIAIGAAAVIVVGVIAITVLNLRVRSSTSRPAVAFALSARDEYSGSPTTDANSGKLVMFSGEPDFSTGAHALFTKDCELGVVGLEQCIEQFCKMGALWQSRNSRIGWKLSFVERQVQYHFRDSEKLGSLAPNKRYSLQYKVEQCPYRWLGEPKLGDFGLARLLPMLDRYVLSSKIQSALGYMAPEFACRTVKINEKCDVYGFGVLVLEVVSGRRPVEYMEDDVVVLCDMVRGALEEGRVEECVDERLQGKFPVEEAIPMMKLGLICTSQVPSNRPDMGEVVNILELIRCPSEGQEDMV